MLYAKSAEKVDAFRPDVATSTFNPAPEAAAEVETEVETETTEEE